MPLFSNDHTLAYAGETGGLGSGQKGFSHSSGNCLDLRRLHRLTPYSSHPWHGLRAGRRESILFIPVELSSQLSALRVCVSHLPEGGSCTFPMDSFLPWTCPSSSNFMWKLSKKQSQAVSICFAFHTGLGTMHWCCRVAWEISCRSQRGRLHPAESPPPPRAPLPWMITIKTVVVATGMCHATREVLFAFLEERDSSFMTCGWSLRQKLKESLTGPYT